LGSYRTKTLQTKEKPLMHLGKDWKSKAEKNRIQRWVEVALRIKRVKKFQEKKKKIQMEGYFE